MGISGQDAWAQILVKGSRETQPKKDAATGCGFQRAGFPPCSHRKSRLGPNFFLILQRQLWWISELIRFFLCKDMLETGIYWALRATMPIFTSLDHLKHQHSTEAKALVLDLRCSTGN